MGPHDTTLATPPPRTCTYLTQECKNEYLNEPGRERAAGREPGPRSSEGEARTEPGLAFAAAFSACL